MNPVTETMAFKQHLGSKGSKPDRIFWSRKGNFLALVALKVTSEMSDQLSRCNRAGKAGGMRAPAHSLTCLNSVYCV